MVVKKRLLRSWIWFAFGALLLIGIVSNFTFAKLNPIQTETADLSQSLASVAPNTQSEKSADTINGIAIAATNFRIADGHLLADVCYDKPTQADWLLAPTTSVKIGDESINLFSSSLIENRTSASGEITQRCDTFSFPLSDKQAADVSEFQIVVPRLETSWPDSLDCDAAQKKLDAQNSGIVIRCVQGEGFSGPEVVSRPGSISDEEMYALINDAFIETFNGPWILTGKLQ